MNAQRPLCCGCKKEMKNGIVTQTTSALWNMLKFVVFPTPPHPAHFLFSFVLPFRSISFRWVCLRLHIHIDYRIDWNHHVFSPIVPFVSGCLTTVHIQNYTWDWLSEWVVFFCVRLWHTRFELDWIAYAIFISGDWAFDIDDTHFSRPSAQITLLRRTRRRSSKRITQNEWTGNWGYLRCEWTGNGM